MKTTASKGQPSREPLTFADRMGRLALSMLAERLDAEAARPTERAGPPAPNSQPMTSATED